MISFFALVLPNIYRKLKIKVAKDWKKVYDNRERKKMESMEKVFRSVGAKISV